MPLKRVSREEAESYVSSGIFFNLKDDEDSAQIRLPYKKLEDVISYVIVHNIGPEGKPKHVACLRTQDESIDLCPFCQEGMKQKLILLIDLINVKEDKAQIWTRGKSFETDFLRDLRSLKKSKNLAGALLTVTRFGKKGDSDTKYAFDIEDEDDTTIEDLPETLDPVEEGAVICLTEDEMLDFIDTGKLPGEGRQSKKSEPKTRGRRVPAGKSDKASNRRKEEPLKSKFKDSEEDDEDEDEDEEEMDLEEEIKEVTRPGSKLKNRTDRGEKRTSKSSRF